LLYKAFNELERSLGFPAKNDKPVGGAVDRQDHRGLLVAIALKFMRSRGCVVPELLFAAVVSWNLAIILLNQLSHQPVK